MTQEEFKEQIKRLQVRFGAHHFDIEFCKLAFAEVGEMPAKAFKWAVETWLGHRPAHQPPLLAEFREARLAEEKAQLKRETEGARKSWIGKQSYKGLQQVLVRDYPGAKTVCEAIEIAKKKLRKA